MVEKARAALTEERAKRGVVLAATLGAEERRAAESWAEDLKSWRLADIIEKKEVIEEQKIWIGRLGAFSRFPRQFRNRGKKLGLSEMVTATDHDNIS